MNSLEGRRYIKVLGFTLELNKFCWFFLATYLMNLPLCPTSERFVVSNSRIHAIYSGADLGVSGRVLPVLHFSCVAWL